MAELASGVLRGTGGQSRQSGDLVLVGLREKKRQERADAIIDAATDLFRSKGYENTKMEEIAERASISPPTLYRYFPTKPSLLIAFLWKARVQRAGLLDAFVEKSASLDPVAAVTGLLFLNNKNTGPKSDRPLWRETMAALLRFHDTADDEFRQIKHEFEGRIEHLLTRLRREARIQPDTPVAAMTAALYAIASENFHRAIANEFRTGEEEKAALEAQVALLLKGWIGRPARHSPSR